MNANLTVKVIGGAHSGKSALAKAIVAALRRNKLYGTALKDGTTSQPFDEGPVKVLVETHFVDPMLAPNVSVEGPEVRTVGLAELKAAFLVWELQRRAGKLKSDEDIAALPAGQVAEGAAEHLWHLLNEVSE